jgi:CBS domain-containing protein
MLVRDLMHTGLITCSRTHRLGDVADLLRERHVHAVVVADDDGRPIGVVADTDLLVGEWLGADAERQAIMASMTAGEVMSTPFLSASADDDVAAAIAQMRSEHVARLVVLDGGRAVGMIAISDVVAAIAEVPMKRQTVADVMSRGIVTCRTGTPVRAAARAMTERRSRSIVVIDAEGRAVGLATGFDLLGEFTKPPDEVDQHIVDNFMHRPVTIGPSASLQEAADMMLTHEIHRLLVVEDSTVDGPPLGLVSTSDIVALMASRGSVWR